MSKSYSSLGSATLAVPKLFFVFAGIVVFSFAYYTLTIERTNKMVKEIERIETRTRDAFPCMQYALVAIYNGWFPCFNGSGQDSIFLYTDEVWKYGKTCNGEKGRYPGGFPVKGLRFRAEFSGTEKECLIQEKLRIYNYPNLPECKKRNFIMLRPAGNIIDR